MQVPRPGPHRRRALAGALLAAMGLAACTVVPLAPAPVVLAPVPPVAGTPAQLVVQVAIGTVDDPRALAGFGVAVDGQALAWLPGLAGTAVVPVASGTHRVRVWHPWRSWGPLLPVPESGEVSVQASVDCVAAARCGIVVTPGLDRSRGLVLRMRPLDEADALEGVPAP